MEKVYDIEGMKCDGCVKKWKKRFSNVTGVEKVVVDLAKKQATVTGNPKKEDLVASLADTKFSVK